MLFNPIAGRGKAKHAATEAAQLLAGAGWAVESGSSERAGHTEELARDLGRDVDVVVSVGGDGSLREAAAGVLAIEEERRPALGFVPLGNANVMAREFGLSFEVPEAVKTIVGGREQRVDVMYANGNLGLAMLGVGYDATVTRAVQAARTHWLTRGWYRLNADSLYLLIGVLALFEWRLPRFTTTVDGRACAARGCSAVIANVACYAKGWTLTPGAVATDGSLDAHIRKRSLAPFTALTLAAAARKRRVPGWIADYERGRSFVLESDRALGWQLDGDPMGKTKRIEVEVAPGAIVLLVPGS